MACLFCLDETDSGISIFGESPSAKSVRNLIAAHFWFDVNNNNNKIYNSIILLICVHIKNTFSCHR